MVGGTERCSRDFNSERTLRRHLRVKHTSAVTRNSLLVISIIALVVAALAVIALQYLALPPAAIDRDELLTRYLSRHEKIVLHIHATIKIFIDGNELQVPANIGIEPDGRMKYIHTYDTTGVIHIESPIYVEFTLGDFMKVWGKRFDSQCFDTYCGSVKVSVNGVVIPNPPSYIIRDKDWIVVEVTTS